MTLQAYRATRRNAQRARRGLLRLGVAAGLLSFRAPDALARSQSAPYRGCSGCHGGGEQLDIQLLADGELTPGQATNFTLTIAAPGISRAGFFASADGIGEFMAGSTSQLTGEDLTHRGAAPANGGQAQFQFAWTPPAEAGGADIYVFALGANGDNRTTGDKPDAKKFSFVWGCDGVELFEDADRDGYGSDTNTSLGCGERDGWALTAGDCNSGNDTVHPGAPEQCNERDDDCDGEVDEETEPFPVYPDGDGDGFGEPGGEAVMACAVEAGYALTADDCDDNDASSYPDAPEICDGRDNNCDGRVDENAKARCGVGWCERLAPSCYSDACYPGEPQAETCNGLDDDCDGTVDNNVSCAAGESCFEARCIPSEDATILGALQDEQPSGPAAPDGPPGAAGANTAATEPNGGGQAAPSPGNTAGDGASESPGTSGSAGAEATKPPKSDGSDAGSPRTSPSGGCSVALAVTPRGGVGLLGGLLLLSLRRRRKHQAAPPRPEWRLS